LSTKLQISPNSAQIGSIASNDHTSRNEYVHAASKFTTEVSLERITEKDLEPTIQASILLIPRQ
jgi:hypothetical protein